MYWIIIVTTIITQIPSWALVWLAYADISRLSSEWSPQDAIVERFNQLGYTLAEVVISSIYMLKAKASIYQRRVMLDLIYVNVLVDALDLIEIVLVWLNINGISHFVQVFSYAFKFLLEFVVLNQLMAVAARGIYKENFAERRYHHQSITEDGSWGRPIRRKRSQPPQWSAETNTGAVQADSVNKIHIPKSQATHREKDSIGPVQVSMPLSPSLSCHRTAPQLGTSHSGISTDCRDTASCKDDDKSLPRIPSSSSSSDETVLPIQSTADEGDRDINRHSWRNTVDLFRSGCHKRRTTDASDTEDRPMKARVKRAITREDLANNHDEEGEIALHMWERRGEMVLEIP